jgi:hypothetical protein
MTATEHNGDMTLKLTEQGHDLMLNRVGNGKGMDICTLAGIMVMTVKGIFKKYKKY